MKTCTVGASAFLIGAILSGVAVAQAAFNIDIGALGTPSPSPAYSAIGDPGTWNAVQTGFSPTPLVNTAGQPTNAAISYFGGGGLAQFDNPLTMPEDEFLLDDYLSLSSGSLGSWFIGGLDDNLQYQVIVYAWDPASPVSSVTDVGLLGGSKGMQPCGGAGWTGAHVEHVTYVWDVAMPTSGFLVVDVAAPGGNEGSCNGIQIRELGPPPPTFCTAKTALVCGAPSIATAGAPSATAASGFMVSAGPARACRSGLLLYNQGGPPAPPFLPFGGTGNGVLCVSASGLKRAAPIDSGGTPGGCDGAFAIDVNAFARSLWSATGCNPPAGQTNPAGYLSTIGASVHAQVWGRDSVATGQFLSDGVAWTVGP